jgi:hypothetical protein
VKNGVLQSDFGYITGRPPPGRRFSQALDSELDRLREFLNLGSQSSSSQVQETKFGRATLMTESGTVRAPRPARLPGEQA